MLEFCSDVIISSTAADYKPRLLVKSSSTSVYPWRPPKIFESPSSSNLPPPTFRSPHSTASCEFEIHYSSKHFISTYSLQVSCPSPLCCFSLFNNNRWPVKLVQYSTLPYYPFSFSCTGPCTLRKISLLKVHSLNSSACVNVHVSIPYNRTCLSTVLCTLTFVSRVRNHDWNFLCSP
jgi:hypothetical protein